MWLWDANWRYISETQQERVKRSWCLSAIGERGRGGGGQKRASKEGGGSVSVSVSLKREWGKGGWEIMRAREQTVGSHRAHSLTHVAYV